MSVTSVKHTGKKLIFQHIHHNDRQTMPIFGILSILYPSSQISS